MGFERESESESEWFQDVVRFALKASTSTPTTTGSDSPPEPTEEDPLRRKLIQGILFTRRLILTYHIAIIGGLALLSLVHWSQKTIRWRRRRRRASRRRLLENDHPSGYSEGENAKTGQSSPKTGVYYQDPVEVSASSSGSSTVDGTTSPTLEYHNAVEETPLLHHNRAFQSLGPRRTLLSSTKAFLMYQPPPIPFINKSLPPNGTSIAILAFLGLNIFYMFFHLSSEIYQCFIAADRFGMLFVANLPYLYLLSAKNQPLRFLTGRSYESLNLFHRRLGELLCLQALLHATGMICTWYLLLRPNGFGFVRFLMVKIIIYGLVAFFAFELLYLTSLASFRQRWYELFLCVHVVLQVLALIFLFLHHAAGRPYVGVALAIFLLDRLVYRFRLKSTTVDAHATIMEDDETVKLSADITLKPESHLCGFFGKSITDGWQATDHVFVTVPSLGRTHMLQSHPFTIASRAPTKKDGEVRLDLLIRGRDGFSGDLLMRARSHRHLKVRLDGPYGSTHPMNILEDADLALVVAGGSGIAVAWPLIHHLLDKFRSSDIEAAPNSQLRKQKIVLIWIIHKAEHIDWLGQTALADAKDRGAEIILPGATEEIGRPNLTSIMNDVLDSMSVGNGTSAGNSLEKNRTGVVVSGPDSMGRLVRNRCAGMVRDGMNVDITVEKFGW
ncbi:Uncharacterized protein BP5553_08991 [Venustampulla echinocandica]|uniref:FAD-binding FR-type domain-containing protein n=1 Tax=Venustampulla echinocandica TaxID=2656787 RepID=A0A370TDK1_9HELO|nr:Uncharacterized protein BP5553_08991 [Venustampulla echinocandica]RDL32535.1 Uncharacterized protein BP5553_08991 [Venustampulla echinocandica]